MVGGGRENEGIRYDTGKKKRLWHLKHKTGLSKMANGKESAKSGICYSALSRKILIMKTRRDGGEKSSGLAQSWTFLGNKRSATNGKKKSP